MFRMVLNLYIYITKVNLGLGTYELKTEAGSGVQAPVFLVILMQLIKL